MYKHEKISIYRDSGERVDAIAPVIVSASRSTDIPAFHLDWFFKRLSNGYCAWTNPFNRQISYVAFSNTRCIVFWSKNPGRLIEKLQILKDMGINSYVQFTLNDYEKEGLEPNVPGLEKRIDIFKRLVDNLGFGSVIWRYDPVLLTSETPIDEHIERIRNIAEKLKGYSEKLVFSFADISKYNKVKFNLDHSKVIYQDFTFETMTEFAGKLVKLNEQFGFELATCGEMIDLTSLDISHNRCIDPLLMARLFKHDERLMEWLGFSDMFGPPDSFPKDQGQRSTCGCILSKDIGAYDTCGHGCLYCYANTTPDMGRSGCLQASASTDKEMLI